MKYRSWPLMLMPCQLMAPSARFGSGTSASALAGHRPTLCVAGHSHRTLMLSALLPGTSLTYGR